MLGYEDLQRGLDLITDNSARTLNLGERYGIETGRPANLMTRRPCWSASTAAPQPTRPLSATAFNGILCINTLASGHQALSNLFGGKTPMVERFAAADWSAWGTGSPVLDEAVASFDCRISQISSVGTHDILYCEVLALRHRVSADGLVYFDRHYHGVSATQ